MPPQPVSASRVLPQLDSGIPAVLIHPSQAATKSRTTYSHCSSKAARLGLPAIHCSTHSRCSSRAARPGRATSSHGGRYAPRTKSALALPMKGGPALAVKSAPARAHSQQTATSGHGGHQDLLIRRPASLDIKTGLAVPTVKSAPALACRSTGCRRAAARAGPL